MVLLCFAFGYLSLSVLGKDNLLFLSHYQEILQGQENRLKIRGAFSRGKNLGARETSSEGLLPAHCGSSKAQLVEQRILFNALEPHVQESSFDFVHHQQQRKS